MTPFGGQLAHQCVTKSKIKGPKEGTLDVGELWFDALWVGGFIFPLWILIHMKDRHAKQWLNSWKCYCNMPWILGVWSRLPCSYHHIVRVATLLRPLIFFPSFCHSPKHKGVERKEKKKKGKGFWREIKLST